MIEGSGRCLGTLGLVLLLSSLAHAQRDVAPPELPSPEEAADSFMQGLIESLELTEEQTPRVRQSVAALIERRQLRSYLSRHEQASSPDRQTSKPQQVSTSPRPATKKTLFTSHF